MMNLADHSLPTPANDDDVFRTIEMTLLRLLRTRRELLDIDISILPPDRHRQRSDTVKEIDEMISQALSFMEARRDWFRHKL
jgi:hypothetical protein